MPFEIPRLATDPPERVFPGVWKLLPFLRLPSQDGSLSLPLLPLFLSFIFFPTSFQMGCFFGCFSAFLTIWTFVGKVMSLLLNTLSRFVIAFLPRSKHFLIFRLQSPSTVMSPAGIQKLFCGIYSAFKCSFDEFVGEHVVSPSYSSAILGLLPQRILKL